MRIRPESLLLLLAAGCNGGTRPPGDASCTTGCSQPALAPVTGFQNPGNLDMFEYVPAGTLSGALVVALHGCTQTAADYENAGWSSAANAYGFVVLYPQETLTNNVGLCFNWFLQEDTDKNGEALSIANAIQQEIDVHQLDALRVYVTGLSAGGAMTAVLLADYPDKGVDATTFTGFAGGQINAGVPYGAACSGTANSSCPSLGSLGNSVVAVETGVDLTPEEWGDRVRSLNPSNSVWPPVSLWQGTADVVVNPVNLTELVAQWTDVWGLGQTPSASDTVAGFPHDQYQTDAGQTVVESYQITGMGHGTAIDSSYHFQGEAGAACGQAAPYILDEGICSTYYALVFWGEAT